MSSSSSSSSSSLFVPREYYCYQCDRIVNIVSSSELICPICHGGFLEAFDTGAPNPNPHHNNNSDNFPMIFSSGSGGNSLGEFGLLGGLGPGGASRGPNEFNPFLFLHNYLNTLRAGGGIQLVFETSGGGGGGVGSGVRGAGGGAGLNLGDYFIGAGLEQLIQQLAENGQTRHGAPPAAKSAVEGLPDVKITEKLLATDSSLCAVCKDNFEVNEEAKRMPCKHLYHKDCIFPWLELHNSCPVCRYELPTDDPDYERRRRSGGIGYNRNANNGNSSTSGGGGGGSGSGSGNQDNANNNLLMPRTVERRLRISWPPWMFRFGSSAETSNGGGGGGNNNDGGGNSGSNGNNNGGSGELNSGSQGGGGRARQEDVD